MERVKYFLDFMKYARDVKEILTEHMSDFEVYVFGSVVRKEFSPGLSDIDIAIVSDEFESREKRMKIYDLLFEKFFDTPFEFHLLTKRRWEFYLKLVGNDYLPV
ncbi:MAG: nucleotidyltransferase domain-containing protein [Archaeoglobales archaeon]|nr:MAG: nucleotidyltransferase domain-containing protein [Archaeoglobales archaeon]